jgi:hypothetical protein
MKNAITVSLLFLILWGLFGLMDGYGFIGGIKKNLIAIWELIGIVGKIIVFAIIVGLIIKVKN